jgi:hypothetical protein
VGSHGFSWVLSGFSWVLRGSQGVEAVLSGYSDCAFLGSQVVLRQAPPLCIHIPVCCCEHLLKKTHSGKIPRATVKSKSLHPYSIPKIRY